LCYGYISGTVILSLTPQDIYLKPLRPNRESIPL
jgi:hypothetical protein